MKGILFKPDMIKAIREGRKTVTRRVIKPQPQIDKDGNLQPADYKVFGAYTLDGEYTWKPRYQVGETVYIKEAWATEKKHDNLKAGDVSKGARIYFKLGAIDINLPDWVGRLRSTLHLPFIHARYFIKITDVRAERLQEITEEEAQKEGSPSLWLRGKDDKPFDTVIPSCWFETLWNTINKPSYDWESNPWVFRYEFKNAERPE